MRIEGERHFDAPPDEVFRALTDPAVMKNAFGAIESIETSGEEWKVLVRPPFPGGFKVKFSVRLEDLREAEHARLRAWGKSLGGRVSVDSSFDLEPERGGTHMRWDAEVDAAGRTIAWHDARRRYIRRPNGIGPRDGQGTASARPAGGRRVSYRRKRTWKRRSPLRVAARAAA